MKCWEKFAEDSSRLKLARNSGSESLQEIAFNFFKYGFIKDTDKWLGG